VFDYCIHSLYNTRQLAAPYLVQRLHSPVQQHFTLAEPISRHMTSFVLVWPH